MLVAVSNSMATKTAERGPLRARERLRAVGRGEADASMPNETETARRLDWRGDVFHRIYRWSPLSSRRPASQMLLEKYQVVVRGPCERGFHGAVARDHVATEGGQRGATPPGATLRGLGSRGAEELVHLVQQQPGAPVRHAHLSRGSADGARRIDGFEQRHLAGAQARAVVEHDA